MDVYKSSETFDFNGKTYNKVNVTSSWNNIAVRKFGTNYYNEYQIPEGAYDYNGLVTEIINVINQFLSDNNITGSVTPQYFKYESNDSGTLINTLVFPTSYIELVAMENGLQQILPFTASMMYCHNKDYENTIYPNKQNTYTIIFQFDEIFDLIWLNDNFAEKTESYNISYPNCYYGTSCNYLGTWANTDNYGSIVPDNDTTIDKRFHSVYLPNGLFNTYGLLIVLLTSLQNSDIINLTEITYRNYRFMITLENDVMNIYRNRIDNKWSIIYANGLFSDHISNYQIKYFDPVNWTDDGTIRINIRPNQAITLQGNNFNYNPTSQMMYTNQNGVINNTSVINDGLSMYYNTENSIVKVSSQQNISNFYAHFASIDITATFNNPDITKDYNVYFRIFIDSNKVLEYTDTFKNIQSKNVTLSVPKTYFGKGNHNILILTNANQYNYIVNEWSIY